MTAWFGVVAPRNTPAAVIERVQTILVAGLRQPGIVRRLTELGATPLGDTSEEFSARVRSEHAKWGGVIRQAGIRLQ